MSTELALADTPYYEEMNDVVTLYLEGRNASWIAKNKNIKRADVIQYIDEFKRVAKDDELLRARGQEVVREFDEQHNRIIAEMWAVVREAESAGDLKTRATAVKSLSDITAKRVEVLQKAGMLSDAALGDELAETQEAQEKLMAILRDVTQKCDHCRFEVAHRLQQITGKVEVVTVPSDRN
jgi:predicted translin family RNA/ssDNA-binding protein